MLTEARTLPEVLTVLKMAEALHAVARLEKLSLEAQNMAAEQAIRAKRKGGDMLREMPKRDGGDAMKARSLAVTEPDAPPALADLGITKNQSSTWQRIAGIPEERFEQHIEETKAAGEELTTASLLRVEQGERAVVAIRKAYSVRDASSDIRIEQAVQILGLDQWDAARRRADTVAIAISYADAIIRSPPPAVVRDLEGAHDLEAAREKLRVFAERAAVWAPAILRELAGPEVHGLRVVGSADGMES
jgi:peptidoglycan/xylan/chitin deacetylase (PgdA/CDA1 family)